MHSSCVWVWVCVFMCVCVLQADAVIAHATDAAGAIRKTSVKPVSDTYPYNYPGKPHTC